MSKRILIVGYGFPPSNSVAVHRILRLSKWLPNYGWKPTILTVKTKYAHPYMYNYEDSDLNALVSDELTVHRTASFEYPKNQLLRKIQVGIMSRLAIPDLYVTWVPGAVYRGKQLISEHNFDAVLTSIPPNSTALIGYFLKKLTSAKWVMDYRDPWCPNPFNQLGRIRYSLEKKIEDSMLSRSDLNVSTSELITKLYRENYPRIADQFCTITNCYDPELQFVSADRNIESRLNHKFRIVHAGSFYPKRNPTSFLNGLVALLSAHPDLQGKIEVLFVGKVIDKYQAKISELIGSLSIDCQMIGAVSYKESMQYICSSDLLLAINGTEDRDNIFVPGKLFDYIAANKPILFIGHRGAASEIVEQGNIGAVCEHDDIDSISREILGFYRRWELSQPFEPNTPYIHRYHASNVAKQLAELLDSVVRPRVEVD